LEDFANLETIEIERLCLMYPECTYEIWDKIACTQFISIIRRLHKENLKEAGRNYFVAIDNRKSKGNKTYSGGAVKRKKKRKKREVS